MIISLILSFLIFLFPFYLICRDDFVMLRKNITLEKLFNLSFLIAIVALFFSRLFFVIFNFSSSFFNPLYFISFFYFPGLSFSGAIIGALLFLLVFAKKEKLSIGHLLDCFSIPLLLAIPVGLLINFFTIKPNLKSVIFGFSVLQILIYFVLFAVFYKSFQKAKFREGVSSLLFFTVFSFLNLISIILKVKTAAIFFKDLEIYSNILILLISFFLLLNKEGLFLKAKSLIKEKHKWSQK